MSGPTNLAPQSDTTTWPRKLYLAGPMTNIPDFNFPRFNRMAAQLRLAGYEVLNPAENFGGDTSRPRADYLAADMAMLAQADGVAVLPGWESSGGALHEVFAAQLLGLPVIDARDAACHMRTEILIPPIKGPVSRILTGVEGSSSLAAGVANRARHVAGYIQLHRDEYRETLPAAEPVRPDFRPRPITAVPSFDSTSTTVCDFSGEVDGGGYKGSMDDPKKLPFWLVPTALTSAVARVLGYGAKKYAPNNWRRGMPWSEAYSALQRHLTAWNEGEDTDPESGLNHLDHAGACLAFLLEYVAHDTAYSQYDNRFKRPDLTRSP